MYRFTCLILLPFFLMASSADKRLEKMTLDEKIGELFVIPICPKRGEDHRNDVKEVLEKYHIGSVIPKFATRKELQEMLLFVDECTKTRHLCLMDVEWGLGMRMSGEFSFPRNLTLGAGVSEELLFEMGREIGFTMKEVGGHVSLGPVVDVNINPGNPIIHMRSFGANPEMVGNKAVALLKGLQAGGVAVTLKHFPGHGNVDVDPHLAFPLATITKEELIPFEMGIEAGAECVMSAHIGQLDKPFPMSFEVMTKLLKEEMGFEGVVITDAMNMKAIDDHFSPGEAAIAFLRAGHDLLLYGDHLSEGVDRILRELIPQAVKAVKEAVLKGEIEIDSKVLKIIKLKEKFGLIRPSVLNLKQEMFDQAITLIGNDRIDLQTAHQYVFSSRDEITNDLIEEIDELVKKEPVLVILYMTPYAAKLFSDKVTILIGYEMCEEAVDAVSRVIKGELTPKGKLPI